MKKNVLNVILMLLILLCATGCSENKNYAFKSESVIDTDSVCSSVSFNDIDKLAEYIIQNKDEACKKVFEHTAQKSTPSVLNIYTLSDVPKNYILIAIQ